jgi:VWFA-related protein
VKTHWLALAIAAAGVAVNAQQPNPGESASKAVTIAASRTVLVDAVVKDKKGKFIRDLSAKDFRVWEGDKEQPITSFSREKGAAQRTDKRFLLFFFDNVSLSRGAQVSIRQETGKFVDSYAAPNRYMAVVNFRGNLQIAQTFTTAKERLKPAVLSAQEATATSGNESRTYALPSLLGGLGSVVESLGSIRGRKAVVLVGGGYPTSRDAGLIAAAIEACNRANVAIYAIDATTTQGVSGSANAGQTAGDAVGPLSGRSSETSSSQGLLKALADGTGGFLIADTLDVLAPLGDIAQEQDEYYLLSYTPSREPDGTCRPLRVKVSRGEVRARMGYCAAKPAGTVQASAALEGLESRAAGSAAGNMAASIQLPYFYTAPDQARVNLAMEIAPSGIPFEKVKGKPHAELNIAGAAYNSNGSVAARFSDSVKLDFQNDKELEAFVSRPFHYENQIQIPSGQYRVRVAFSAGKEGFGKVEAPLVVEPYDSRTLALSAVALSKERRSGGGLAAGLDDSLVESGGALMYRGAQIVPSGASRFLKTEPCSFYFEIYDRLLAGPDPPVVEFQIRVLDRKTGQAVADTGKVSAAGSTRRGNPVAPVVFSLPIASFPAGAYRVEIRATHGAGPEAPIRTADFEVD